MPLQERSLQSLSQALSYYRTPLMVIAIGVAISISGFILALSTQTNSLKKDFMSFARLESGLMENKFLLFENELRRIVGLFEASGTVTVPALRQFVTPIMQTVSFDMVGWLPEHDANNKLFSSLFDSLFFVQHKSESPIPTLSELTKMPEAQRALEESKRSMKPITSEPFLIPGTRTEDSYIVLLLPYLKDRKLQGTVLGLVNLSHFAHANLQKTPQTEHASIYLFNHADNDRLIYVMGKPLPAVDNIPQTPESLAQKSAFYYSQLMRGTLGQWTIVFIPGPEYLIGTLNLMPWATLIASLLITGLIGMMTFQQARQSITVSQRVEEQTKALRLTTLTIAEKENRLRAVVNHSLDGLITIRSDGIIESFNPACERIFGYRASEVIGHNVSMLMPEPYHSEHDSYITNYRTTGNAKFIGTRRELTARRKDGSIFPIDLGISEITFGNNTVFSGIVRDITEKKNAESEREKLIGQLANSNEELERFAYVASHDLKAPLRAIDNLSQWIEEDLDKLLEGETRNNMTILRKRVRRMEKLLDDILEYSRVGRKIDHGGQEEIDGKTLVEDIILLVAPPKSFTIRSSEGFEAIRINRMPLQQIIYNLVTNAIKHHHEKSGLIELSVEEKPGHYAFSVKDNGPGIARQYHQKIFEMFQTLQPRDRTEGSGMGLALVKKILTTYGGEITVESEPGHGSTFIFTWPKTVEAQHHGTKRSA